LRSVYAPFITRARARPDIRCRIEPGKGGHGFAYVRNARKRLARTAADLLFLFDKDITVLLQRQRKDLFFIHAGVVRCRKSAVAFVAPSGTGKSTTVWALLCDGLAYVSDELLPVDLQTLKVEPYPRALCLKTAPPAPYELPAGTLDTHGGLLYVPPRVLAKAPVRRPLALAAVFFLNRRDTAVPQIRSLGIAEAGARLYANALNPLAHPGLGLDAAISIAARTRCYELHAGTVAATSKAIRAFLRKAVG